ncbi:hypothetical protein ACIQ1D_19890 [Lysinibacillus xylanilyticus]|uniref:hypothetical protein n=1 Tax=Lysinibacillus xylanilyticus TaxID=582475 RepID=UPI0038297E56
MKVYLIVMFWGALLVLAVRIFTDYNSDVNPFNEPLSLLYYLVVIFWIIIFAAIFFKKFIKN